MKKIKRFLPWLLVLCSTACDCVYSYDVYVENRTGTELRVNYQSIDADADTVEGSIVLPHQESLLIISEGQVFPGGGCPGTSCSHCPYFMNISRHTSMTRFPAKSAPAIVVNISLKK